MLVRAYKAGKYRLRITVPKPIYETFVKYNTEYRGSNESPPYFVLQDKDKDGTPYFSNCDFGLELRFDISFSGTGAVQRFAKSNMGIRLFSREAVHALGLVAGMKLKCEIIDNPRQREGSFNKIIGYTIVNV